MLDHPFPNDANVRVSAPGIAPMLNVFNPLTACAYFWRKSAFELGSGVTESWLRFAGDRWLKDLELPQLIASCRTPGDLSVAFSEFWQTAAKDYSAQLNQIANLTWSAMRESFDEPCAPNAGDRRRGKCAST